MSERNEPKEAQGLRPQVIEVEESRDAFAQIPLGPRVTPTRETGRVVAAAPTAPPAAPAAMRPRASRLVKFGLLGLAAGFAGWLAIDSYLWIRSAFGYDPVLGTLAAAAVAAGIAGVAAIVGRELRSFFALRSIEKRQELFAAPAIEVMRPSDMQDAIRATIAAIPSDAENNAAVASFQRKVQRHHTPAQQIEIFSSTVLAPLDRRAEAAVRRASARAFGIVAISPTALTDALFFVAVSVRMVREVAESYGHRPTAYATAHLLRRLVIEAGRLGAIDLAAATLTQHIGGALAERLAAGAAESVYATQRMARLGLVTMELCRPVPFARDKLPGILSSLVGNVFAGGKVRD